MNPMTWNWKHLVYAMTAAAVAGVGAWSAATGHPVMVGGMSLAAVLTTLKALEDNAGVK